MQVVCSTCQLSFDAPEGATGLVCPICRGPLLPKSAEGDAPKAAPEWRGGDIDDLIALLSAPAASARVEVLPATGDAPVGEVHLLAGGVSDAFFGGKSTDDALDKLRAVKSTRFRIDQRLPNPADGNLVSPGPEAGTLDGRALAHLMRYCEDYVITCAIDVWRGNENARVEYKRGEIAGVTVGGIDAPERLAEVMQWSSGNYRLVVPPIKLPAVAPKRAKTEAPAPAPAASAQAARQSSATKTMFGMPLAEVAKARAAAEAAKAAAAPALQPAAPQPTAPPPVAAQAPAPQPKAAAPAPRATTPVPVVVPAAARVATPPGVAPSQVPSPVVTAQRSSATKTIFGVPSPSAPDGFVPARTTPGPRPVEPPTPAAQDQARAEASRADRKMGARKVDVPAPAVIPPAAGSPVPPARAAAPAAPIAAPSMEPSEPQPTTQPGFDARSENRKRAEPARPAPEKPRSPKRETPIWTYVGVGFTFGLALLGIYQLYGLLAH
jgi:hypothetical protein